MSAAMATTRAAAIAVAASKIRWTEETICATDLGPFLPIPVRSFFDQGSTSNTRHHAPTPPQLLLLLPLPDVRAHYQRLHSPWEPLVANCASSPSRPLLPLWGAPYPPAATLPVQRLPLHVDASSPPAFRLLGGEGRRTFASPSSTSARKHTMNVNNNWGGTGSTGSGQTHVGSGDYRPAPSVTNPPVTFTSYGQPLQDGKPLPSKK